MSFDLERKLIEGTFKASMPAGSEIEFDNDVPFRPTGDSYTRLAVMSGGEGRRMELTASNKHRFPGVIDVAIFIKPEVGTADMRTISDQVANALANQSLTEGTTRITTYGARLDVIGRVGDWFQGNITIRYERDTT